MPRTKACVKIWALWLADPLTKITLTTFKQNNRDKQSPKIINSIELRSMDLQCRLSTTILESNSSSIESNPLCKSHCKASLHGVIKVRQQINLFFYATLKRTNTISLVEDSSNTHLNSIMNNISLWVCLIMYMLIYCHITIYCNM